MRDLPLVEVEQVSKKFCRSLRRSLWYGLRDLGDEVACRRQRELRLRQGEFLALDDVSFAIAPGECVALIGHNGAGKSTLLKMLNGLIRPDHGRITMRGRVGALIELGAGFSPVLTGRENIYVNGAVLGFSKKAIDARFDKIVEFAELRDAIDAPVQTYSSGMYVRLGFAVASQLNPDVLLIDEVLAVGDTAFRAKCMNRIWSLIHGGAAVILVTHNMYHVQAFATRALLLDNGRVAFAGDPAAAVSAYESQVADETIKLTEPKDTGVLLFQKAALESCVASAGGSGWPAVETHQGFRIVVQYELTEAVPDGIQLGLLIKNLEGNRVAGFTTKPAGLALSGEPGRYRACFEFRDNLLLEGKYYCGLSAFNASYSRALGSWDAAVKFWVRTPGYDGLSQVGNVYLPHEVTVSEY